MLSRLQIEKLRVTSHVPRLAGAYKTPPDDKSCSLPRSNRQDRVQQPENRPGRTWRAAPYCGIRDSSPSFPQMLALPSDRPVVRVAVP